MDSHDSAEIHIEKDILKYLCNSKNYSKNILILKENSLQEGGLLLSVDSLNLLANELKIITKLLHLTVHLINKAVTLLA